MVKRYRLIKSFNRKCDTDVHVNGDDRGDYNIALCTSCRRAKNVDIQFMDMTRVAKEKSENYTASMDLSITLKWTSA